MKPNARHETGALAYATKADDDQIVVAWPGTSLTNDFSLSDFHLNFELVG